VAFKTKFFNWARRNPVKQLETGRYELHLKFYFTFKDLFTKKNEIKRLDVSNRIKLIEDQLAEHLGIDDRYFFKVTAEKILGDDRSVDAEVIDYEPTQVGL